MKEDGVFLIIGGSGGIGEELAYKLRDANYTPIITYNNNKEIAEKIAEVARGDAYFLNLLDIESIDKFVDMLILKQIELSGIIMAASHRLNITSFGRIDKDDMDKQWRVNVLGYQRLTALLIRKVFQKNKKGIIVGILSKAMGDGHTASMTSMGAYIISKYGMQGLLSVLRMEYKWLDVISSYPDFTDTKMLNAFDHRFVSMLESNNKISSPKSTAQDIMEQIYVLLR